MKKLCYFLLFLFISLKSFSQETEKLPKIPWEDIVEMNSQLFPKLSKWKKDIFIKLEGNYTKKDSLEVDRVLKKLDTLTETISINFSKNRTANYKIKFLNEFIYDKDSRKNIVNGSVLKDSLGNINEGAFYIYLIDKSEAQIIKSLESKLAKILIAGNFPYEISNFKRKSIFNVYTHLNNSSKPLNTEDIAIVSEIYKKGFKNRLKIAEVQFKKSVLKKLKNAKTSNRNRNIWWVRNPIAIIILPVLLLTLLSIYILGRIKTFLSGKIKKDWLQFGFSTIALLFFADIIIILSVSTFDFLTIPDDYSIVPFVRYDTVQTTILVSLMSIPILFLFRFIESKIQGKANSILLKTFLIFLSTGFLPFIFLCIIFLISFHEGQNKQAGYTTLANIFVVLMVLATIRALISYFYFKERKLILDNELKLSNLRELNAKSELKSLQSQINPHFLYNALNSIASLAHTNADKTEKMALSLSDLFKYTINRKGKKTSTINDELEMVRSYLEIEQTRFGDRLEFVINAKEEVLNEEIPMFILQPLVENAVKHGISKIEGKGIIDLNILKTEKGLDIEVKDNGPDFPEGLVSGHGLQTVYDLLRLTYGDKASLKWQNTPQKSISILIDKTV